MKRLALACLWLALIYSPVIECSAYAAGAIGKLIKAGSRGGRVADEAAGVARQAWVANRISRLSPELQAAFRGGRGAELAQAYQAVELELKLAAIMRRPAIKMSDFERLLRQPASSRAQWNGGSALTDDLPNVLVRAPPLPGASEALRIFAQSRLKSVLDEPFDVNDLRVAVAGLADDAAASAAELAAFRRTIPASHLDDVGYLSHLDGTSLTRPEMVRRLEVYRGKTVVIVGHVPEGSSDFILHLPGGSRSLHLQRWLDAAEEAGANLIAIGCNSDKLSRIGAKGLLNSKRIRTALRALIEKRPDTIGGFFRELTSRDLQIVVDPLSARLFSNGIIIRDRQSMQLVGQLMMGGTRVGRGISLQSETSLASTIIAQQSQPCFARATSYDFNACVSNVRVRQTARLLAEKRDCRAHNLKVLPHMMASAHSRVVAGSHAVWIWGFLLAGAGLLTAWLVFVADRAREDEQDRGTSLRHIFNRWHAFELKVLLFQGRGNSEGKKRLIGVVMILGLTAGLFFALQFDWYVWILYGLAGLTLIGSTLESGKSGLRQGSMVDLTVAVSSAALLIVSWNFVSTRLEVIDRAETVSRVKEDWISTRSNVFPDGKCYRISDGSDPISSPVTISAP